MVQGDQVGEAAAPVVPRAGSWMHIKTSRTAVQPQPPTRTGILTKEEPLRLSARFERFDRPSPLGAGPLPEGSSPESFLAVASTPPEAWLASLGSGGDAALVGGGAQPSGSEGSMVHSHSVQGRAAARGGPPRTHLAKLDMLWPEGSSWGGASSRSSAAMSSRMLRLSTGAWEKRCVEKRGAREGVRVHARSMSLAMREGE